MIWERQTIKVAGSRPSQPSNDTQPHDGLAPDDHDRTHDTTEDVRQITKRLILTPHASRCVPRLGTGRQAHSYHMGPRQWLTTHFDENTRTTMACEAAATTRHQPTPRHDSRAKPARRCRPGAGARARKDRSTPTIVDRHPPQLRHSFWLRDCLGTSPPFPPPCHVQGCPWPRTPTRQREPWQ